MPEDIENGGQQTDSGDAAPAARPASNDSATVDGLTAAQWKAKYDGMNGTAVKRLNEINTLKTQIQEANERVEEVKTQFEFEIKTLKTTIGDLKPQAEEAAKLKREKEVGQMIRKDHPALTELWDEGLLNLSGLEGDALTQHLSKMSEKVGGIGKQRQEDRNSGSTPPPPPSGNAPSKSVADAKKELDAAFRIGVNSPEYKAARAQYDAALIEASKTK